MTLFAIIVHFCRNDIAIHSIVLRNSDLRPVLGWVRMSCCRIGPTRVSLAEVEQMVI